MYLVHYHRNFRNFGYVTSIAGDVNLRNLAWALILTPIIIVFPVTMLLLTDPLSLLEKEAIETFLLLYVLPITLGLFLLWRSKVRSHD